MAARPLLQRQILHLWQQSELLLRQGLVTVQVLHARDAMTPSGIGAHLHPIPTLIACLNGVMRVAYAQGAITLSPGEALVVAPGAWHDHEPLRAGSCGYWQGLKPHASDAALLDHQHIHWLQLPLEPSRRLLHALVGTDDPGERRRLGDALLEQILYGTTEDEDVVPAQERMIEFLWRNLHRPISAAQILRASGLGGRQALRLFQDYFGDTPKRTLLRCHLQLAEQHLREGVSVTEAALASGFTCRDDLTRAWRRAHGSTPSSVRTRSD